MKKMFPIISILAGIYWTISGINYGAWVRNGPGPGFFPIIAGVLTITFGVFVLKAVSEDKTPSHFTLKAFKPIIALIILVLISKIIGLVLSIPLYIFVWLKFVEKEEAIRSAIIGVLATTVIYSVFVLWLRVPLPSGILDII
jgi:energy-coupling factor transporter transmembrane protein EcfT